MRMITIQDVGIGILNGTPKNFYVFGGCEYGIKLKYLTILKKHYNGNVEQYDRVDDLIKFLRTKHFIPLSPALYIVRYDEEFLSSINESTDKIIKSLKFDGTIVCIYDNDKHLQKLDKYIPDYTVSIGTVSDKYIEKYLKEDFTEIPDNCIHVVSSMCTDYSTAMNICNSLSKIDSLTLRSLSPEDIKSSVYIPGDGSVSGKVKKCIASRNYEIILEVIESYPTAIDNFIYDVLSTMVELEKISCMKTDSELIPYSKRWAISDIYNFFHWSYNILNEIRTNSVDPTERVLFLVSLTQFERIPSIGDINEF